MTVIDVAIAVTATAATLVPPVSVPVPGGDARFDTGEQATVTATMVISTFYLPETAANVRHQHVLPEVPELVRRSVPS